MVQGRTFTAAESLDPEARVTIINARLARRLWPDGSAVGRRVGFAGGGDVSWMRVVGVVARPPLRGARASRPNNRG